MAGGEYVFFVYFPGHRPDTLISEQSPPLALGEAPGKVETAYSTMIDFGR